MLAATIGDMATAPTAPLFGSAGVQAPAGIDRSTSRKRQSEQIKEDSDEQALLIQRNRKICKTRP